MGHNGNTTVTQGHDGDPGSRLRAGPGPSLATPGSGPSLATPGSGPSLAAVLAPSRSTMPHPGPTTPIRPPNPSASFVLDLGLFDSAGYRSGPRRPSAGVSGRSDPDFPHFTPRLSTWQFIVGEAQIQVFWPLTVEECGVQWSAVVEDGGRR